ncbi:MAG: PepSY domain-containing protein, partial [Oscillospiraceae bacterium]|nr:PepSY domain-containing protein [Oscillospiraceae bacterium]
MNKRKIALIGVIVALFLSGCASVQDGQSGGANDVGLSASSDVIGAKEAEKAALDHAGFTSDQVIFTKSEYDRDSKEYEIEFTADDYRYEYDIGAADGSIIEFSKKIIDSAHDTSGATSSTTQTTHTTTTPKTPAASTTPPGTGEAVSAPPPISDTSSAPSETGRITLDEAKAAALVHAGVTASEVTFTKNKLDYDDGREEYDIEFVSGDYEYEYEIDAASGEVLSYSKEARSRQ